MTIDGSAATESAGLPEQSLIARLEAGHAAAVGEAYDTYHEVVRRFSRRLVGDDSTAEDLVHEVFLKLPRLMGGFRGESSLRTFLIAVAVNHARHHVRAAVRRRAAAERASLHDRQTRAEVHEAPDHQLERRQLAAILTRCLDRLPLDQRVAFVLCEVEGRTSRESAQIVGAPEGTVRTRLFHAKRQLRLWIEEEGLR